jgi:outer membrane biosynthesis protein TonB
MYRSLSLSIVFHIGIFAITFFTLPFIAKKPIDVPPVISIDLIQISEKTALPFAPKAKEIIEKIKDEKEKERVVTKQAPPKIVKKEKQDAVPMPDQVKKKKPETTDKQNPEEVKEEIRQSSEFEKKELFDPNKIAALIDKAKEDTADIQQRESLEITQDQDPTVTLDKGLTITQEDAVKAQIFKCWNIPLGLPYEEDLTVRVRLKLNKDGSILSSEILDHVRMNRPGQGFYKVLAESALRAVRLCNPLKMPATGHDKWKDLQLNFDAKEMLKG